MEELEIGELDLDRCGMRSSRLAIVTIRIFEGRVSIEELRERNRLSRGSIAKLI